MNAPMTTAGTISLPYRAGHLRDYVFPLIAALAVFALPFIYVMYAYILVGQAHFFMAFLYQYRGGKMTRTYLFVALALAAAAMLYLASGIGITALFIVAGTIFSAHFALDEFTLHGEPLSPSRIVTIAGFAALHSSLIITVAFPSLAYLWFVVGGVFVVYIMLRTLFGKSAPSRAEYYLWFIAAILFFFATVIGMPSHILGIIVLLHFVNWYVGYGDRLKQVPDAARRYWKEVAVTLAISSSLLLLYLVFSVSFLAIFFDLTYFYLWTAAHIVLSFVTATYRLE
jgi:hypothetical protein